MKQIIVLFVPSRVFCCDAMRRDRCDRCHRCDRWRGERQPESQQRQKEWEKRTSDEANKRTKKVLKK